MATLKQKKANKYHPYLLMGRGGDWYVTEKGKAMAFSTLWFIIESMTEDFSRIESPKNNFTLHLEPFNDYDLMMRGTWFNKVVFRQPFTVGSRESPYECRRIYIRDGKGTDSDTFYCDTTKLKAWVYGIWEANQKRWRCGHDQTTESKG